MEGPVMTSPGHLRSRTRNNAGPVVRKYHTTRHFVNHNNNKNRAPIIRSHSLRNQRNYGGKGTTTIDNDVFMNGNGNNGEAKIADHYGPGSFTRAISTAISPRLGLPAPHIPEESVQALFNDMHLYPTKSQVSEMLQCARQCGRRNGASKYITFGEFCVFVREMQNQRSKHHRKIMKCKPNNICTNNCEVFLGGSCNPTTWRADAAIPELQKHGITYYNPQVSMWVPELVAQEHDAKQAASVLLFVVDSQTRSTVGMIEVAYLVASGRCVVLVAQPYRLGQSIMEETITEREFVDLVEGQNTLLTLVQSKGIKVHSNLHSALQCTANLVRNANNSEMSAEEQVTSKLRKLREVFDFYGGNSGEITILELLKAFQELTHREVKPDEIDEYLMRSSDETVVNRTITFDRFCMLMAEFTTDNHCDMCNTGTTNVWASQSFQRQCSTNNNNTCNTIVDNLIVDDTSRPQLAQQHYDVFLGGTRHSKLGWRQNIAIPLLKKHGITYYNPTLREECRYEVLDNMKYANNVNENDSCSEQSVLDWKHAMDCSKVLLFVITNDTRSLTSMILAAHYIGLGRNVVLMVQQLPDEECVIFNETLSSQAVKDYNRGRVYVTDMAKRKQIPVFENITEAVQCVIEKVQGR